MPGHRAAADLRDLSVAVGGAAAKSAPDLVCAFLPPVPEIQEWIDAMAEAWPTSLRLGCEAVTQFADGVMTGEGAVQLFWLDHPDHRAEALLVHGPADPTALDRLEAMLEDGSAAFLLADGLRFPVERFLSEVRGRLGAHAGTEEEPLLIGGLASQAVPIAATGARIFLDREIIEGACLVVVIHGVGMEVEIVRGWDPASPIYTVTGAEGNVLYTIDDEPATDWFRRFFTVDGVLATLPDAAYRFPLIVDGPKSERRSLYRSMKEFDQPPGAITFWGDLEVGDHIRIGIGNDASLLRTAGRLPCNRPADAAMLYSCVGREAVLGDLAEREVATIHDALGGASLAGFFTFGEIGPSAGGGLAYYNHTAVLALLRERPS